MNLLVEYQRKNFKIKILKFKLFSYYIKYISKLIKIWSKNLIIEILNSINSLKFVTPKFKIALLISITLLLSIGIFSGAHKIFAQSTVNPTNETSFENSGVGNFTGAQNPNQGVVQSLGMTTINQIIGYPNHSGSRTAAFNPYDRSGGALSAGGQIVAMLYDNSPASSVEYFAYLKNNAGFVSPSYAANSLTGYDSLSGVQGLWTWARNLSYGFLSVILVIIGFIILLRGKLGQAEVSVINSLPRVALVIILITFSYAIAGLIIDIMNVSLFTVSNTLFEATGAPGGHMFDGFSPAQIGDGTSPYGSPFSIFHIIGTAGIGNIHGSPNGIFQDYKGLAMVKDCPALTCGIVGSIGNAIINVLGNQNILLALVISIAALITFFKLLFILLTNYAKLVLMTITAPFAFLIGALPGRSKSIVSWFRTMGASALSFVVIYAAFGIIVIFNNLGSNAFTLQAPLLYLNTNSSNLLLNELVGFAIFLMTPSLPKLVDKFMGVEQSGFDFGREIGGTSRDAARKIPFIGGLF